jgi:hypothetical protein
VFLVNSCLDLVIAALFLRHSFSRSYGVILPSSLERVISRPLVYSTYPPVSVMVQAFSIYDSASFSWKSDIHCFNALASRIHVSTQSVFAASQHLEHLNREPISGQLNLLRPSLSIKNGTGILTRCPSTTLFSLALGPDLPSADEPSGGNLGFSGYRILTYIFVTQADILTSASSISAYANTSTYNRTLPYRYIKIYRTASANYLVPFIFGAGLLDQ